MQTTALGADVVAQWLAHLPLVLEFLGSDKSAPKQLGPSQLGPSLLDNSAKIHQSTLFFNEVQTTRGKIICAFACMLLSVRIPVFR